MSERNGPGTARGTRRRQVEGANTPCRCATANGTGAAVGGSRGLDGGWVACPSETRTKY
jgi:hypothetical protein